MAERKTTKKDQEVHASVEQNAEANEERHGSAPDETPGGFHPDSAEGKQAAGEAGTEVGKDPSDPLAGLSRRELVRLQAAVNGALEGWGEDPADAPAGRSGPTLQETASGLPVNQAAAEDLDRKKVAKEVDVEEGSVLTYSIHQAGGNESTKEKDQGYGTKYLVAVLNDGSKKTVEV